ncbi:MAG: WD40/YVTN/BNR-like repeat-containing protein [Solirubrobacterales bacterium]
MGRSNEYFAKVLRGHRFASIGAVVALASAAFAGCGGSDAPTSAIENAHPASPQEERAEARESARFLHGYTGAELVSGERGWARTHEGLYWTEDGGREWREITPPGDPATLDGVYFRNPEQGWAGAEEGQEGENRVVLFATGDGGRTWRRRPVEVDGLGTIASGTAFAPVGRHRVFALVGESRNTAYSVGHLFTSGDGGRHWHQLPDPPHRGPIAFESPREGWLAAEGHLPGLYRTDDGGHTWTEVKVAPPPGVPAEKATFRPPRINAEGGGLLPVVFDAPQASTAVVYRTEDRGRSWEPITRYRMRLRGAVPAGSHLYHRGDGATIVSDYGPPPYVLLGPGRRHPAPLSARGLPPRARLSFAGARYGFALVHTNDLDRLYRSEDGGKSWKPTSHP